MPKKIIRKPGKFDRFELPEEEEMRSVIEQIKPLMHKLGRLQKTERQREIDNQIVGAAGSLIKSMRECGLEISTGDMKVEPLWPDAAVLSERRLTVDVDYEEEGGDDHVTKVKIRIRINNEGVSLGVKITCDTSFGDFLSPNASPILLLNDDMSNEYDTDVHLSKSEKPTLVFMDEHLQRNSSHALDAELDRAGGVFEVSFELKRNFDDDLVNTIQSIKQVSERFANADVFERGTISIKRVDANGREIEREEITETQFMDRFMSQI